MAEKKDCDTCLHKLEEIYNEPCKSCKASDIMYTNYQPDDDAPDELDREAKLIKFIESELLICEQEILNSAFLIMHDTKCVKEYWKGKLDAYTTLKQKIEQF